jgi:predicted DNA-binding protein YlxM (UPF0122 family)
VKSNTKNEIGRPTLFQQRFCKMLVDHMKEGFSFTSFAGKARVSRRTLYDWCRYYPEFLDAYETGYAAALLFHEKQLLRGIQNKFDGSPTLLIFALKTRFHREYGITEQNNITDVSKPIDISKINDPAELARLAGPPKDIRQGFIDLIESSKKHVASMDRIMNSPLRDRTKKQDQES